VKKGDDGQEFVDLGKKKRVSVSSFKGISAFFLDLARFNEQTSGSVFVDIREYYGTEGDMKPGKKGIALSTEQVSSHSHHSLLPPHAENTPVGSTQSQLRDYRCDPTQGQQKEIAHSPTLTTLRALMIVFLGCTPHLCTEYFLIIYICIILTTSPDPVPLPPPSPLPAPSPSARGSTPSA
jgi:hypothetical protein